MLCSEIAVFCAQSGLHVEHVRISGGDSPAFAIHRVGSAELGVDRLEELLVDLFPLRRGTCVATQPRRQQTCSQMQNAHVSFTAIPQRTVSSTARYTQNATVSGLHIYKYIMNPVETRSINITQHSGGLVLGCIEGDFVQ